MNASSGKMPVCLCCGKATLPAVISAARGWCPGCESEYRRVLVYLETVARVAGYASARRG